MSAVLLLLSSVALCVVAGSATQVDIDRFFNASVGNRLAAVRSFVENGSIVDVDAVTSFSTVALHGAALRGHRQVVDYLISVGADINGRQPDGATPLLAATFGSHEALALHLLSLGARANESNASGAAPLHGAALLGHPELAAQLLAQGVDVAHADESNITALHGAAMSGRTGIVQLLLARGASATARTTDQQTPLHYACAGAGSPRTVHALANAAADGAADDEDDDEHVRRYVDARDGNHRTALHWCALHGRNDTLLALLELGADATLRDKDGMTPLALAFEPQHSWVVKALLDAGAPGIALPDNRGRTVLHWAAERGFPQLTDRLLNYSAPIDARDRNGMTPAHHAARKGHGAVLQVLYNRGADVLLVDVRGWSIMHYGALAGSSYATLLLAAKGVPFTTRTLNDEALAPLHIACRATAAPKTFWSELIGYGADPQQRDGAQRTPLHHCVERANVDAVRALLAAGADLAAVDEDGLTPLDVASAWTATAAAAATADDDAAADDAAADDAAADDADAPAARAGVTLNRQEAGEPKLRLSERRRLVTELLRNPPTPPAATAAKDEL